jgi:Zn-finger nucleic acid-binding protein
VTETEMTEDRTRSITGLVCPVCRVSLVMAERQNVEIDYCPQCRGVWLDRGEIDKIVERSLDQRPARGAWSERPEGPSRDYESQRDPYEDRRPQEHRRRSWLSDLFD